MWMIALKDHGYAGRRITVGQKFKVRTTADATVLRVIGAARDAKKSEIDNQPVTQIPPQTVVQPKAPEPELSEVEVEEDAIVYEKPALVETREEEPETEKSEKGVKSTRKERRRYKRNDMVPEE